MFGFVRRVSMIYMFVYFSIIAYYVANYSTTIRNFCINNYKLFIVLLIIFSSLLLYVLGTLNFYENQRLTSMNHYRSINEMDITLNPINFVGIKIAKFDDIKKDPT